MSVPVDSSNPHQFNYDPDSGVCYRTLDFLGYPGYRVGDDGSVWSRFVRNRRTFGFVWRKLKLGNGHIGVTLTVNGKHTRLLVHRLVLEAFVGPCPPGMECCHFPDRNPANNHVENLRWDTHKNNLNDRWKHGTMTVGENNPGALLKESDVVSIRQKFATGIWSKQSLADEYGVTRTAIYLVVSKKNWKHVQ